MRTLAVLGASGHGRVVADAALQAGWSDVVFFDDNTQRRGDGQPVKGRFDDLLMSVGAFEGVVVGIGDNRTRLFKMNALASAGHIIPVIMHPNAYIADGADIKAGSVIFAGAVVQTGCSLGLASIINTGATVDHDCSLADGVHVSPGANLAGGVVVGECSWIGIGSSINQYLTIGSDVIVGAGAAVVSDAPSCVTLVGVPAKILSKD